MSDQDQIRKSQQPDIANDGNKSIVDTFEKTHDHDFDEDLHPAPFAGNNNEQSPHPEKYAPTAESYKDLHERFPQFRNDELRELPILPPGTRLEQGAKYCDLREDQPREFAATAEIVAGENNLFVPKSEVDYQLWNRLIGVDNPERTGEADDGAT